MNLPSMHETKVLSLVRKDPMEEEMATHSSIPAWESPWTEDPGGPQFMGLQRVRHDCVTSTLASLFKYMLRGNYPRWDFSFSNSVLGSHS